MLKAYEVMTHALATCSPDASVAQVAAMMRDRDIGDVLIVENGKLKGIVTDRDLALQALNGEEDPLQTPVSRFMNTRIVTGDASWTIDKVSKTMAAHQVRRLPVVEDGKLVGIISLGDIARHEVRKHSSSKLLQAISTPASITFAAGTSRMGTWIALLLVALATGMAAWLTWNSNGQSVRKQMAKSDLYRTSRQAVKDARGKLDDVASSKQVRALEQQIRSNINTLSTQLPTIEYKPPKRKLRWLA